MNGISLAIFSQNVRRLLLKLFLKPALPISASSAGQPKLDVIDHCRHGGDDPIQRPNIQIALNSQLSWEDSVWQLHLASGLNPSGAPYRYKEAWPLSHVKRSCFANCVWSEGTFNLIFSLWVFVYWRALALSYSAD